MSNIISELKKGEALAQQCCQVISAVLAPGMREQDAASLMREWLKQQGVSDHLHRPLAWFGTRTALSGRSGWLPRPGIRPDYYPGTRSLRDGMPVALYCAPRLPQASAEALSCFSFGPNPEYQQLLGQLSQLRDDLATAIASGHSVAQLEAGMHGFASRHGLQLRHRRPPVLDWLRPYDAQPDTGYADQRLIDKLASMTGNPMPAHLPTSGVPLARSQPLPDGLWVIQPWLSNARHGAGLRALLHLDAGTATWLTNPAVGATDTLAQTA